MSNLIPGYKRHSIEEFSGESKRIRSSAANREKTADKKTRGRVKIKIELIQDRQKRCTTFSKRKAGLMKKSHELATLTGSQVMVLVASETGHIYTHATPKFQPMLNSKQGRKLIKTCLESDKGDIESISDDTPAIEIIENDRIDRTTGHESDDSLHEETMNVVEIQNRPNFKSINALVGQNISDSVSDQPVANIPLVTSQLRQRVAPNLQQSTVNQLPLSEKLCSTIGPPRHLEEYRTISSVPVSLRLNRENPDSLEFSYLAQNEHHAPPNPMLHRTLRASASPKLFKAAPYLNHNNDSR